MTLTSWFRVNLLFLFITAVFSVGAFIGLWKLHEVQTRLASTTVAEGIWAISQGEGRLLDVLNVTQRYIRTPTSENAELFHERLDFMWNRLDVLSKGTIRNIASHYPEYEDTIARFRQALKRVDTLLDPLTPETAKQIYDLLRPFQTPFHHMLVSASQAVTAERADKQRALQQLVNIVALCLAVVLVSGFAALLYLYRENNRAKSEMQARAHTEEKLRIAIAEAQAANRAKSTFLANMSHELRTPLNSILGFAQLTSQKIHGDRIDAKYLEYAEIIENSSSHLLSIINDILDLARIEAGKVTLDEQSINITKCVNTCRAIVEGNEDRARIVVDIADETPGIVGDERLIRQTLLNLLSNATKFTPGDGRIIVTSELDEHGGVQLVVSDSGCGMSGADSAAVVEPFYQVQDDGTHSHDGVGLGLSLAKQFIELHGGTLSLESEIGEGTTVTLTFPPARTIAQA